MGIMTAMLSTMTTDWIQHRIKQRSLPDIGIGARRSGHSKSALQNAATWHDLIDKVIWNVRSCRGSTPLAYPCKKRKLGKSKHRTSILRTIVGINPKEPSCMRKIGDYFIYSSVNRYSTLQSLDLDPLAFLVKGLLPYGVHVGTIRANVGKYPRNRNQ